MKTKKTKTEKNEEIKLKKWEDFLNKLDTSDKTVIYNLLESEYIKEDIIGILKHNGVELSEEELKKCINIAVSKQKWDANKSYSENIKFHIQLVKEN